MFFMVERSAPEPVLPLGLFRNSVVRVATTISAAEGALVTSTLVYAALFAQGVVGASATGAAVLPLPFNFAWMSAAVLAGRLVTRTGRYRIFPIVGFTLVVAGIVPLTALDASSDRLDVVLPTAMVGFGFGLGVSPTLVALQNSVAPPDLGTATAMYTFAASLGSTLGLAASGTILMTRLRA
jgi:MFS family permease